MKDFFTFNENREDQTAARTSETNTNLSNMDINKDGDHLDTIELIEQKTSPNTTSNPNSITESPYTLAEAAGKYD